MTQQSILGRIAQLTRANINALLDAAEDPEKMLDQMIRDYTNNIDEANDAVATTIGNLRMMEEDEREARETAQEWGAKAAAAAKKADELRAEGNTADADKFENLARIALKKQIQYEEQAKTLQPTIAQQTEIVDKLKAGLQAMNAKLEELKTKRSELVARAKMARAQAQVQDALGSVDVMDPTSEISRFEDKIRREESRVAGQAELAASSLDAQFEDLEDAAQDAEVEARLAALRGGSGGSEPTSG
ncbi:MAG TPA: PspA/IM30 family protein [Actinomycetota bacterium]|nr:PspA/IM30 family protein [Actinomycetota bacterium]